MGVHGVPRPLASAPRSRTRVSWPGTMLAVPTTGTPCPHENPQRQVILTHLPIDSAAVSCQGFRKHASWPARDVSQANHYPGSTRG